MQQPCLDRVRDTTPKVTYPSETDTSQWDSQAEIGRKGKQRPFTRVCVCVCAQARVYMAGLEGEGTDHHHPADPAVLSASARESQVAGPPGAGPQPGVGASDSRALQHQAAQTQGQFRASKLLAPLWCPGHPQFASAAL